MRKFTRCARQGILSNQPRRLRISPISSIVTPTLNLSNPALLLPIRRRRLQIWPLVAKRPKFPLLLITRSMFPPVRRVVRLLPSFPTSLTIWLQITAFSTTLWDRFLHFLPRFHVQWCLLVRFVRGLLPNIVSVPQLDFYHVPSPI